MQRSSLRDAPPSLFHPTSATGRFAKPNASGPCACPSECYAAARTRHHASDYSGATSQRPQTACPRTETVPGQPRVFYLTARYRAIARDPHRYDMPAQCNNSESARTVPKRGANNGAPRYRTPAACKPNSYKTLSDGSDSGDASRNACSRTSSISGRPRRRRPKSASYTTGAPLHALVRLQRGRSRFSHPKERT